MGDLSSGFRLSESRLRTQDSGLTRQASRDKYVLTYDTYLTYDKVVITQGKLTGVIGDPGGPGVGRKQGYNRPSMEDGRDGVWGYSTCSCAVPSLYVIISIKYLGTYLRNLMYHRFSKFMLGMRTSQVVRLSGCPGCPGCGEMRCSGTIILRSIINNKLIIN